MRDGDLGGTCNGVSARQHEVRFDKCADTSSEIVSTSSGCDDDRCIKCKSGVAVIGLTGDERCGHEYADDRNASDEKPQE